MSRPVLEEARIHPAIRTRVAEYRQEIIREVQAAAASNDVVVIGMAMNPFPRKARKALEAIGQPYRYLEYGSYFSEWRRRNALKMWTGWPTLPMIFIKGQLVGGANDLETLIASGEFRKLLAAA
ncbi:MAG: glutaredoxin domain-containing protein [Ramlibacter sp.]